MIVRMIPATKDYLWGGRNLAEKYGKEAGLGPLAESWEFSVHPDGPAHVVLPSGETMLFSEYLEKLSAEHSQHSVGGGYSRFPLLTKLLDSAKPLSIQVHPTDAQAPEFGEPLGKTEMWHILEAQPGAFLYLGMKESVSKEALKEAIETDTVEKLLNKVEISPGENVLVPAGTIHAIGAGITLVEVQEDSNLTFRVSDYGRTDAKGNRRPLHIEQALAVASTEAFAVPDAAQRRQAVSSDYFTHRLFHVTGEETIELPDGRFLGVVVTEGTVTLRDDAASREGHPGDSFFVEAGAAPIQAAGHGTLFAFTCGSAF